MSVTSCFYNLLKETVGVVPRDGPGKVDAATAKLRLDSTILEAAYSAVPEVRGCRVRRALTAAAPSPHGRPFWWWC